MTRRPTLAEFSPEVFASDIQGLKLEGNKHSAYDDHRRLLAAPAEDRAARIEKIANGEAVASCDDHGSLVRAAANRCHDMKEACDLHYNNSRAIRQKALGELSKTLLKEERAVLKRKALALVEAHAADVDHQELKDYLIGQGGLVGICLTDSAKVLGHPIDRTSDLVRLDRRQNGQSLGMATPCDKIERLEPEVPHRHTALKSSGTSPNFRNTVASLKSPVAGSPERKSRVSQSTPSDRACATSSCFLPSTGCC